MTTRVLLVNSHSTASVQLEQALTEGGYDVVDKLPHDGEPCMRIEACNPDLVVVNTKSPCTETLDKVRAITESTPRPIVMFSEHGDSETITKATKAGVSAYVMNDISSHRIKWIIDAAVARFRELQALKNELSETRLKLDERKDIDRAKGLLMSKRKLSENEAYRLLQKMAMGQNKKIGEIAKSILAMADLIG